MSTTQQLAAFLSGLLPGASAEVQGALILAGVLVPLFAACGLAAVASWVYGRWA